jgi:hypothetical protein
VGFFIALCVPRPGSGFFIGLAAAAIWRRRQGVFIGGAYWWQMFLLAFCSFGGFVVLTFDPSSIDSLMDLTFSLSLSICLLIYIFRPEKSL